MLNYSLYQPYIDYIFKIFSTKPC